MSGFCGQNQHFRPFWAIFAFLFLRQCRFFASKSTSCHSHIKTLSMLQNPDFLTFYICNFPIKIRQSGTPFFQYFLNLWAYDGWQGAFEKTNTLPCVPAAMSLQSWFEYYWPAWHNAAWQLSSKGREYTICVSSFYWYLEKNIFKIVSLIVSMLNV